jgi:thiamine biosynthesis lipoprotein
MSPAAPTGADGPARRVATADWQALGCQVRLAVTDPSRLDHCRALLERHLAAVDMACSRFRPTSELVALDHSAGRPVRVSPLLAEAIGVALRAAALTGGDVDPTVGSAMAANGYDRDFDLVERDGHPVCLTVRPVPGWRRIRLDRPAGTVTVPPGIRLDLGATATAWPADGAAAALAAEADCGVLVGLGGDTALAGPPPQGGWRIRVQDVTGRPDRPPVGPYTVVAMRSGGLATSGTTARTWRRGAQTFHHIVDPRTGLPADAHWRTVTVAAASCTDANIASTAAIVRGLPAMAWLDRIGLPARLVTTDGQVDTAAGWPQEQEYPRGDAA